MTKRGIVFCISAMIWSAPAMAGFEIVPANSVPSRAQAPAVANSMTPEPPMPILPTEPVSAEPLAPPVTDRVLSNRVSPAQEPTYVRRTTTQAAIRPPANQPFDSEAILDAAILGNPLEVAEQPIPASVRNLGEEYIAINPYPMNADNQQASHNDDVGTQSLERGMMEETGRLRAVATPGAKAIKAAIGKRREAPREPEVFEEEFVVIEQETLTPPPRKPFPPAMAESPKPVAATYTEAVGFGKELPLALALSQVVPAGYTYSFADNIDAGATVSWEGGKPWNEVLSAMLAPSGMRAVIRSNQVVIESASS